MLSCSKTGDDHKRMKRIMQPAFTTKALREMLPTFLGKARLVREMWTEMLDRGRSDPNVFASATQLQRFECERTEEVVIDASTWMSRFTLDVIGSGSFIVAVGSKV